jgi:predicted  nucleic acid-binding Zn-ribbon protein
MEVRSAQREMRLADENRPGASKWDCQERGLFHTMRSISALSLPHLVITSRQLIGASVLLLALSAVFGILNLQKTRGLRTEITQSETARQTAEQSRDSREKELKGREAAVAAAQAKFGDSQSKVSSTEAELLKAQTEKNDLQAKLRANETEIAELRKRIEEAESKPVPGAPPATSSAAELQAQLEDAKKQLDAAEREKILLSDKMKVTQERSPQLETARTHRPVTAGNPGIRGTVLAVNQAYNFVVLSLGGRQGVEPNSEMLVLRSGSFIGKIRISSVEPATAIGDIITSSLARGVQVQPGDIVVYGGSNH